MTFCWHCGADDHTDEEMLRCMMSMSIDAYLELEELGLIDEAASDDRDSSSPA